MIGRRALLAGGAATLLLPKRSLLAAPAICNRLPSSQKIYPVNPQCLAVPNGLVGYWPLSPPYLDFNRGLTQDISGNNNTGTLNNLTAASLANGPFGVGLTFNGTNSYINLGTSAAIDPTGDMSIATWIILNSFPSYVAIIIGKPAASAKPASFDYYVSFTGQPNFLRGNGSAYGSLMASTGLANTGIPYHVAVTMKGTEVTHYLNGQPNGTGTISASIGDAGTACEIGNRNDASFPLNGMLFGLRLVNYAYAAWEVTALYQAGLRGQRTLAPGILSP
jgi:hypothetical protein